MKKVIDLRSDTFTLPSDEMRRVAAEAVVGDDVFGEDPSVNALQEYGARLLGKEAALFVASGTMGNQVAVNALTQPGQEVILDEESHIFYYEAGAPAMLSGVQLRPLKGQNGILTAEQIETAIRADNVHFPPTSLICLENTLNRAGGRIFPLDEIQRIRQVADKHGLKMHLDGARLWNASVATGISMADYAALFDSLTVCFSKGLGAPVGSLVAGDAEFIKKAHRYRKMYGGGMRQAGMIAAPALYACQNHVQRLADDHAHARRLAEAVSRLPGCSVNLETVQTNIVMIDLTSSLSAIDVADHLSQNGVLVLAVGPNRLRAVTHLNVNREEIERAIAVWKQAMEVLK